MDLIENSPPVTQANYAIATATFNQIATNEFHDVTG